MTRAVLRRIKHQKLAAILTGSSSSIPLANGFNNNAYLFHVKGTKKLLQKVKKLLLLRDFSIRNSTVKRIFSEGIDNLLRKAKMSKFGIHMNIYLSS